MAFCIETIRYGHIMIHYSGLKSINLPIRSTSKVEVLTAVSFDQGKGSMKDSLGTIKRFLSFKYDLDTKSLIAKILKTSLIISSASITCIAAPGKHFARDLYYCKKS